MRSLSTLALFLVPAVPLSGQVPVVTPEGDPSVSADTIYALAVDPADHPEEDAVLLLDDGIVIQEADGTGTRTFRQVVQILNREAVEEWAEHTVGFDGTRESFRLNWARVVRPDGTVVSEEPVHQQVMDAPVPEQSPVYTDWKIVRISLAGVEPGTIVDVSHTVETNDPVLPGDFLQSWAITTGGTVRRSRFIVDLPEGFDFHLQEENLPAPPSVRVSEGRRIHEWTATDLEWIEPERFADIEEADFYAHVTLSGDKRWGDIGSWYAGLSRDRYEIDEEIWNAAQEVLAEAATEEEKLRALHRWVAQDFRYISISLGLGGYQPRLPEEVFATRSGDCKDKATLFIGLARRIGLEAYPVLLNSRGGVEEDLASIEQFNHAIAAVRRDDGWLFLDLTAELVPPGEIPASYQGEFGLVVFDDGRVEEVTFPENTPAENQAHVSITGTLSEEGAFAGRYVAESGGALQMATRGLFARDLTDREKGLLTTGLAGQIMQGARGDSLVVFDGRDLTVQPRLEFKLEVERALRTNAGGGWIFTLPMPNYASPTLITQLEEELDTRRHPIDVGQVIGPISRTAELVMTLPEGWRAELPEGVRAESAFGRYESEYVQDGRELRVRRRMVGNTGTQPKEALADLIAWLEEISRDDVEFLVINPSGTR